VTRVRSLGEAEAHIVSLLARVQELERMVSDHAQRFDTLQTPLWKRVLFRLDGWPGQRDLNGVRSWRPWHRRR
jgi:hypothetical protein